jgi:tripartite ATP-independent transporter DctM subunit
MTLLFLSLAALMLIGAPIFVAIGGAAAIYLVVKGIPPLIAIQQMVSGIDSFPILAVPFFVLAGNLMNAGTITDRLYAFAHSLCGHWKGGLGHVNVIGSVIFSGMSGTAVADASGLGQIEVKAMRDRGYDTDFAVGISAASATIGPVIPPSLPMVVYGFSAQVSVGQLFVAGIIPGLLMAASQHLMVGWYARRRGYPVEPRATWAEVGRTFVKSGPALAMPAIIMGGIIFGIVTPTEAAAVASAYALGICVLLYRTLDLAAFLRVMRESFETTATVMLMVGASTLFGWVLVRENAAQQFTTFMLSFATSPEVALIVLNLLLLVAGMFLETIAIILIAVPIVMPVVKQFGIDPVQFGIIMVLNLMIGLMTPPVGLLLFVMSKIGGIDFWRTFRACAPFLLPIGVVLLIVTFVPWVSLALPRLIFR